MTNTQSPVERGFRGLGRAMSSFDMPHLAFRLAVGEDHLRAFVEVEAASRGYDRQGRPRMLFEPHVFYRNLSGANRDQAVARDLAYPRWGQKPYPSDSYPRLEKAVEIDEDAALKACSIGLSQVLVENFSMVGYASPQAMWNDFMDDEEAHVEAMVNYILATGIADDLRREDWRTVARVYNGPGYEKNGYHTKMAAAFAKFRAQPDVDWEYEWDGDEWVAEEGDGEKEVFDDAATIRSVQTKLRELGYTEVGKADGLWGVRTRAAVLAFSADNDLDLIPEITGNFLAALMGGQKRIVSEARQATTAKDLKAEGSRTVDAADKAQGAGILGLIGGAAIGAQELAEGLFGDLPVEDGFFSTLEALKPAFKLLDSFSPPLFVLIGGYVIWQQWRIRSARVEDARTGANAAR